MKNIALFVCLLFISLNLFSQEEFGKSKFSVALKGGLNMSNKHKDKPWDSKFAYRGGLNIDYGIHDYIYLRAGGIYNEKGSSNKNDKRTLDYNMQYITIPVGLGVFVPIEKNFNISLTTSVYADIGMKIESNIHENGKVPYTTKSWKESNLKQNDFGISVDIEMAYRGFLINAGYERGLNQLSLKKNNVFFPKWYNNCAYLTAGYRLVLKK